MPQARSIPILVLAGQSNANNSDIIRAAFDKVSAQDGLMVHLAVNGSPLSAVLDNGGGDWSAAGGPGDGELFRALMRQLDGLLNPASPTYVPGAYLDGVIWLHGGADIFAAVSANSYGANLAAVDAALTARFGAHDLVISGMADASFENRDLTGGQARNWLAVQAAQADLAATSARIHLVDPDVVAQSAGLSAAQMLQSDFIHYSSTFGYAALLGKALANAAMPPVGSGPNALDLASAGIAHIAGSGLDDKITVAATGMTQVWAGKGLDTVSLTNSSTGVLVIDTGPANVRIVGLAGGAQLFVDLIAVESLRLTAAADDVHLGGGITIVNTLSGNDKVIGNAADETVWLGNGSDYAFGQGGADQIYGGYGSDSLWGALGNDVLFGGNGNDRIGGGEGFDTMTGGSGADVFVFGADGARGDIDTITDFTNGRDRLNISGAVWGDVSITTSGKGVLVTVGDVAVILANIKATQIDASDFLFG